MVRVILISMLALSVICMVPLMGADHVAAGHLHHGVTASCATCIGPESIVEYFFFISLLGVAMLILPAVPPIPPIRVQYPVPRGR